MTLLMRRTTMGGAKQKQIEDLDLHAHATSILVKAGTLERCEMHEECTYLGSDDPKPAYAIAQAEMNRNGATPAERKEMLDMIKSVHDEHALSECPRCQDNRFKD